MLLKVPLAMLKPGVFIEDERLMAFGHIFSSNLFTIEDEAQIAQLKEVGFKEIHINLSKGLDITKSEIPEKYIGLPIAALRIHEVLPFDLYLKKENGYEICLKKGDPLCDEVYYFLKGACPDNKVFIEVEEKETLNKYASRFKKERGLSEKELAEDFRSKEKVKKYQNYLLNYVPINKTVFSPGMNCPVSLFTENNLELIQVVAAGSRVPGNEMFSTFVKNDKENNNILIHRNDTERYKAFIRKLLDSKEVSGNKEEIKTTVLKENSRLLAKELLENPRSGKVLKEMQSNVSDMVTNITENPSSFYELMKLETYDYYTYIHSVNVCTLAIGLGMTLGMKGKELNVLATGALMHDVGKSIVPASLINKPGKLTNAEFELVKNHVILGFQAMKQHLDLPKAAFFPLMQHHEKLDGTGYPKGLSGKRIHPYGRILAIVDIYDALTTERSYKKPFKPYDAVRILNEKPEAIDQKIFKEFVQMLGKQVLLKKTPAS